MRATPHAARHERGRRHAPGETTQPPARAWRGQALRQLDLKDTPLLPHKNGATDPGTLTLPQPWHVKSSNPPGSPMGVGRGGPHLFMPQSRLVWCMVARGAHLESTLLHLSLGMGNR